MIMPQDYQRHPLFDIPTFSLMMTNKFLMTKMSLMTSTLMSLMRSTLMSLMRSRMTMAEVLESLLAGELEARPGFVGSP